MKAFGLFLPKVGRLFELALKVAQQLISYEEE